MAQRATGIMQQILQPHPSPPFTRDILDERQIADFPQSCRAGAGRILAVSYALGYRPLQMRFELFGETLLGSFPGPANQDCTSGAMTALIARTNRSQRWWSSVSCFLPRAVSW